MKTKDCTRDVLLATADVFHVQNKTAGNAFVRSDNFIPSQKKEAPPELERPLLLLSGLKLNH